MKLYKITIRFAVLYCILYASLYYTVFILPDENSFLGGLFFFVFVWTRSMLLFWGGTVFGFSSPPLYLLLIAGLILINLYVLKRNNELTFKRFACLLLVFVCLLFVGILNYKGYGLITESSTDFWKAFPFVPESKYD
ncbi:hypothetical protein [Filifactor villosus]|uniref:Uncharacterized protein n=1 Tax=Filifactor villosus TaxID=29374 RepID=A0ABV9QLP1_9FIRM